VEVEYTRHALLRLGIRGIGRDEVEEVLRRPQHLYYDASSGAMVAVGRRAGRPGHWLIVVYTRAGGACRVVTVIDTKSLDRIASRRVASGRWIQIW